MDPRFDVLGIGLNATDTLLLLDDFPPYAGKVPFANELTSPGGQVATAMVCCARLGLKTKYVGTVGDDWRGQVQRASLAGTGVNLQDLITRPGCPNQSAYILIDRRTGERTVLWQRPPCLQLAASEITSELIQSARLLHIDGYDTEAAAHAARLARQASIPVSLDVDSLYDSFAAVLANVDYLVASSTWPAKWTGESDPCRALALLQEEFGFAAAVMTLGDRGALALTEGRFHHSPAFRVACVDTTGAGDAFHGAFCFAVLRRMPMPEALDFANAAAALNCTAIGARGRIGTEQDVRDLLALAARGQLQRHGDEQIEARCREYRVEPKACAVRRS